MKLGRESLNVKLSEANLILAIVSLFVFRLYTQTVNTSLPFFNIKYFVCSNYFKYLLWRFNLLTEIKSLLF